MMISRGNLEYMRGKWKLINQDIPEGCAKKVKPIVVNDSIAEESIRNVEQGLPLTVPLRKLMENGLFHKAYMKASKVLSRLEGRSVYGTR